MASREIFVLSGPNGAGKSTTATVLLPEKLPIEHFVNADTIRTELPAGATDLQAGRVMRERMHALRESGESFAFETTLAPMTHVRFLRDAQARGYVVHVAYIYLASVELALARVRVRVAQGGHDVPPDVVERRYWRGLSNFFSLYQVLANRWLLCDNSRAGGPMDIARGRLGEEPIIHEPETYATIKQQVADARD